MANRAPVAACMVPVEPRDPRPSRTPLRGVWQTTATAKSRQAPAETGRPTAIGMQERRNLPRCSSTPMLPVLRPSPGTPTWTRKQDPSRRGRDGRGGRGPASRRRGRVTHSSSVKAVWIPAFAGMTGRGRSGKRRADYHSRFRGNDCNNCPSCTTLRHSCEGGSPLILRPIVSRTGVKGIAWLLGVAARRAQLAAALIAGEALPFLLSGYANQFSTLRLAKPAKSSVLRVIKVKSFICAIAAIWPSA